jgi:DNA-binding response OmpR family regulator
MTTTSELSLPLTVLVIGAMDDVASLVEGALPTGEVDFVRVSEFLAAPPAPKEFIDLCVIDAGDEEEGIETVRRARRRWPTVGICAVNCADVVAALAAGADDALPRDATRAVLVAQVSAAFRRARVSSAQLRVAYGDVIYDREARRVWCAGTEVSLTPRELRLFDILFLRAGAPVSLDTLEGYVWNDDGPPASNALAVYVSYLRRKLRGSRLAVVETMRGVGYRLVRKDR